MVKIAHYIETLRFCRVHLTFKDTEKIQHHYLIPSFKKKEGFKNIPVGTELINSKNKYLFTRPERDVPKLVDKIKPDIILCSNTPHQKVMQYFKNKKIKVFYIRHGIANKFSINHLLKLSRPKDVLRQFDGYITHNSEKYQYLKMKIPAGKVHGIDGSTMIDYLKTLNLQKERKRILSQISTKTGNFTNNPSDPLNPNKRCILFLQNHQGVAQYNVARKKRPEAVKEYMLILERLDNYAKKHNMHIFTKIKGDGGDLQKTLKLKDNKVSNKIKELHKSPRVTVLFWDQEIPMYNFLFCDVVVVEACGTSLPESFIVNPKTIQCQVLALNDYYDIDKYKLLPQADNLDQLDGWLDKLVFHEKEVITSEYLKQSKEFVKQFYGKVEPVTEKIVDLLVSKVGV